MPDEGHWNEKEYATTKEGKVKVRQREMFPVYNSELSLEYHSVLLLRDNMV
jgi:hypothetical protein